MRRMLLSFTILAGGLASANSLRAGVYNLNPPPSIYRSEFLEAIQPNTKSLESRLPDLRAINKDADVPGRLRAGYQQQAEHLLAKRRQGTLDVDDRINLGGCLIRLGRLAEAREVLEEAERVVPADAPGHFLILLNLARAYQEDPELLQRAIVMQTRALKIWPELWTGWSTRESDWYRRVETFVLRLMNLRQAEARMAGARSANPQTVDDLFAGVRFVGREGRYEAGTIAFDMRNRLPRDAESIVIQMILWQPNDDRLFWLYGELLNARGDLENAYQVLDLLVNKQRRSEPELIAHRRVLRDAREVFQQFQKFAEKPADWQQLFWALAPRGALLTPGIGSAANESAWAAALLLAEQPEPLPPGPASAPAAPSSALPDWRPLLVSFLTGIVVAVLALLQWQQWRRRSAAGNRLSAVGHPSETTAEGQ